MNATQITIAAVGLVFLCIIGIYLVQSRERARIGKIRKITALQERHNRLTRLLHELPPQYLSKDLRLLVIQRDIDSLEELNFLKPNPKFAQAKASQTAALAELRQTDPAVKPVAIRDEKQSNEIRKLLEVLFRFVENQEKLKRLDAAAARKHLANINYLIAQAKADYCNYRALAAQKSGKLRQAIHALHNAVQALKPQASNPVAAKSIANYKAKIKELNQLADEEAGKTAPSPVNDEWSDFMEQQAKDDDWKKKSFD